MVEWSLAPKLIGWIKQGRSAVTSLMGIFRLKSRLDAMERQLAAAETRPSPFRNCPECGERDLRRDDMYRYSPDPLEDRRFLHQKWLCYSCGHRVTEDIEEPT